MEPEIKPEPRARKKKVIKEEHVPTTNMGEKAKGILRAGKGRFDQIPIEPIWNRVKKEVRVAAVAIGKQTEKAAQKTVQMSKQAGIQSQIYYNQLKLQRLLAELGGKVYDLTRVNTLTVPLSDENLQSIIKRIEKQDEKISNLKADLGLLGKSKVGKA